MSENEGKRYAVGDQTVLGRGLWDTQNWTKPIAVFDKKEFAEYVAELLNAFDKLAHGWKVVEHNPIISEYLRAADGPGRNKGGGRE